MKHDLEIAFEKLEKARFCVAEALHLVQIDGQALHAESEVAVSAVHLAGAAARVKYAIAMRSKIDRSGSSDPLDLLESSGPDVKGGA